MSALFGDVKVEEVRSSVPSQDIATTSEEQMLRGSEKLSAGDAATLDEVAKAQAAESSLAIEKAPEKKPDNVDLKHVKEEIRASLEDGWFGVDESRAIKALLSVPEHQMEELMEMYGGQDAFEKMMRHANAFNADEMALITGKLDAKVNPDRFARAIEDSMTDSSWIPFYDDAQPDYVATAMKSMTKSELAATVEKIGADKILEATEDSLEYGPKARLDVITQVARVDDKAVGVLVGELQRAISIAQAAPGTDYGKLAIDAMKEVGYDKVLAAASEKNIDLEGKLMSLAQRTHQESVKRDIWTMAYGKELAEAYVQADKAFGKGEVDGFVEAYGALSEADKKEFLAQFGKVMPKYGSTIERAINGNFNYLTGGAERWAKMAQAIHPDAAIPSPEHMQDIGWDEYADAERELNRLGWQRLKGDTPQPDEAIAKKEEEPEVKTEEELQKLQEEIEPKADLATDPEPDGPILIDPNSPHDADKTQELAKIGQDHKIIFSRIKDPTLRGLVEDFAIAYDSRSQEDMAAFHEKLYSLDPSQLAEFSEKVDSWTPKGTQRSYQQGFKQTFASDVMLASQRNTVMDGQRDYSKVA